MEGTSMPTYSGIIDTTGRQVLPMAYKVMNDNDVLPGWLLYTYKDPDYTYVNFRGIDYTDVYTQFTRVASVEELFKPTAPDYAKYIVGNYANFEITDQNGARYRSPINSFGESFGIKDLGDGAIKVQFDQKASLDGLVGDGYVHNFTGAFDFSVSYGVINAKSFKFGQGEQEGFILSDPQSIVNPTSEVETSWGAYRVKAGELTIYVKLTDGQFYTIKGKRDYSN